MAETPARRSFYETLIDFRVAGATVEALFPLDWRQTIARNRAFYVRGLSWFRADVEAVVSRIDNPNLRIERVTSVEDRWKSLNFNFNDPYAANQQLYPAFRNEPLQFEKAVQTVILLYSYCLEKGSDKNVLNRFTIEPAVSYISGLNERVCQKIEEKNFHYLHNLAEIALQRTKEVFFRLARSEGTVTHKLARRLRDAIATDFPNDPDIYVGLTGIKSGKFQALWGPDGEQIDADDDAVLSKCKEISKENGAEVTIHPLRSTS